MPLQPSPLSKKVCRALLVTLLFALFSNGASAASPQAMIGAGSVDDWLALGLAMLAALYCVQKKE